MSPKEKHITLGVRVKPSIVYQMEEIHQKFYIDKSKQMRCLLSYFFSLPEEDQKQIIDRGMRLELLSVHRNES